MARLHSPSSGCALEDLIAAAPHGLSPDSSTELLQPARDRAASLALCPMAWHCPGMILLFLCPPLRDSHVSSPSHPSGNAKDQGCFCRQQGGHSVKCGVSSLVASPGRTTVLAATARMLSPAHGSGRQGSMSLTSSHPQPHHPDHCPPPSTWQDLTSLSISELSCSYPKPACWEQSCSSSHLATHRAGEMT